MEDGRYSLYSQMCIVIDGEPLEIAKRRHLTQTLRHFIIHSRVRQNECLKLRDCIGVAEKGQRVRIQPGPGQVKHAKLSRRGMSKSHAKSIGRAKATGSF